MPSENRNAPFRIACLGDSHTKGNCGYDWVSQLSGEWANGAIEITGFGVNGELAYNARQRILSVAAYQPDLTLVLLGTNDVNAIANHALTQRYLKKAQLPQLPNKAFFTTHLNGIVDDLQSASRTSIALLTLPPLSEDLEGEANQMVDRYNSEIRNIAAQRSLPFIDLNDALRRELLKRCQGRGRPLGQGRGLMVRARLKRTFLRLGWDAISRSHGLHILTDTIHLNERSGRILAALVKDHVEAHLQSPSP